MQKGLVVDAPSDERQRMLSVLLSLLAVAVDQLTAPAIAPAMQTIQAALNVAPMTARWIAAASLACAVATGSTWLLVARVAQGAALGGLFTSALLTLMGACPPKRLPVVFAWFSVISLATPSFAPLFAGFTMGIGTWRAVFAVMAIPALLGGIGGLLTFHDPYPPKPLPFSVFTFAALATFLLAFQYLVTAAASDDSIPSPWFALVTAGAATALIVYLIREAHSNAPFFDLRLFETPLVGQGATAGLLLGGPLAAALFATVTPAELPSMAVIFKLSTLIGASLSIPLVTAFLDVSISHYGARSDAVTRAYADLWIAGAAIALAAAAIVAALRIPPHQSGSAA